MSENCLNYKIYMLLTSKRVIAIVHAHAGANIINI